MNILMNILRRKPMLLMQLYLLAARSSLTREVTQRGPA